MRKAPPLPFLPQEWHGREVLILAMCWVGDIAAGEKAMAALRGLGNAYRRCRVAASRLSAGRRPSIRCSRRARRNYWKTHDFEQLEGDLLDTLIEAVKTLPGPECEVFIAHVGGAMSHVPVSATAYPQRNAHYIMNVHTRWRDPAEDAACIGWARDLFQSAAKYALGSAYVNFMPDDEERPDREGLRSKLPAPQRNQAALRPRQPLPVEPEHQAEQRVAARPIAEIATACGRSLLSSLFHANRSGMGSIGP